MTRMDQDRVSRARTSLAAAGQLIQAPFMYDYRGRAPFDEPSGREVLGQWAGYRFYRASDDWIFLACADQGELDPLLERLGLRDAQTDIDNQRFLEQAIAGRSAAAWMEISTDLNLGIVVPASVAQLRDRYLAMDDPDQGTYQFCSPSHRRREPMGRSLCTLRNQIITRRDKDEPSG